MAAAAKKESISVVNIYSLSGVNTGKGEIEVEADSNDETKRFSFVRENGEKLIDVFHPADYKFNYFKNVTLLELVPRHPELKSVMVTFKDSDSRDLFKARADEFDESGVRRRRKTTSQTDGPKARQKKTPTVAQDKFSIKRTAVTSAILQGVDFKDINARHGDFSPPSQKSEHQTAVGIYKEEPEESGITEDGGSSGDSGSSGSSGSSSPKTLRSDESSVGDSGEADEDSNDDRPIPEFTENIPASKETMDYSNGVCDSSQNMVEQKYINEEDNITRL